MSRPAAAGLEQPGGTPELRSDEGAPVRLMLRPRSRPVRDEVAHRLSSRDRSGHLHQLQERHLVAAVKPPFSIAQIGKNTRNEITPGTSCPIRARIRSRWRWSSSCRRPSRSSGTSTGSPSSTAGTWVAGVPEPSPHPPARPRRALAFCWAARATRRPPLPDQGGRLRGNREPRRLRSHRAHAEGARAQLRMDRARGTLRPARDRARRRRGQAALAFLVDAYDEEEVPAVTCAPLRLHPRLAPVKVASAPLVGKDADLVGKAKPLEGASALDAGGMRQLGLDQQRLPPTPG